MSELEDLIAVHGAVDQAVAANPGLRSEVARFIGAYDDPDAVGWFAEFQAWNEAQGNTLDLPTLNDALANLSDIPEATSPRLAARRILAVRLAAIVRPGLTDGPDPLATGVLDVAGLAEGHGAELGGLIFDPVLFGGMTDWGALLTEAEGSGFISSALAAQKHAPPCVGRTVAVPAPDGASPAAELTTSFTANDISFECACRFLDPASWPGCSSFWITMEKLKGYQSAQGNPIYHEEVGFGGKSGFWTAETYLEFSSRHETDEARVSYQLSDNPVPAKPQIDVDEGWLHVTRNGTGVTVETLKRVRFTHTFTAPMIAAMMCAMGYGNAAHDLVFNCAHDCTDKERTSSSVAKASGARRRSAKKHSPGDAGHNGVGDVVDDAATKIAAGIRECADSYASAYEKIEAGKYTANDLVADASRMWARALRDGLVAMDLASRAGAAFQADPDAADSGEPDPPPTATKAKATAQANAAKAKTVKRAPAKATPKPPKRKQPPKGPR